MPRDSSDDPAPDDHRAVRRLLRAFQSSDRAQMMLTPDGTVTRWSDTAARVYGYRAQDVVGRPAAAVLSSMFQQGIRDARRTLWRTGTWAGLVVDTAEDGSSRLVRAHALLERTADGVPDAILVSSEVLEPSTCPELFGPVTQPAEMLAILGPATDAPASLCVRHAAGSTSFPLVPDGLGRDDILTEYFPDLAGSALFALMVGVMGSGRPADFEDLPFAPPWVGTGYRVSGRIVPFGDGVAVRARDVTAAFGARQELHDAQTRFRLALETAPVIYAQCDRNLVIEWAAGDTRSIPTEEFAGTRVGTGLTAESAKRLRAGCARTLEDRRVRNVAVETRVPGLGRVYDVAIHPRIDLTGAVAGLACVAVDRAGRPPSPRSPVDAAPDLLGTFTEPGERRRRGGTPAKR